MELHVTKHHQAYVTNFNAALVQYAEAESKGDVAKMIQLQSALKFNGGGHVNHSIFWTNLCPPKDQKPPSGELLLKIEAQWKVQSPSCHQCLSSDPSLSFPLLTFTVAR